MTYDQEYVARFWSKVDVKHKSKCWEWKASLRNGYGKLIYRYKTISAHRIAWQLTHGEIGDYHVLHKCDNPLCCNPNHLFLGTNKDNVDDMIKKRRHPYGEKVGSSKLKESDVIDIIKSEDTYKEISEKYNISRSYVSDIKARRYWKHLQV